MKNIFLLLLTSLVFSGCEFSEENLQETQKFLETLETQEIQKEPLQKNSENSENSEEIDPLVALFSEAITDDEKPENSEKNSDSNLYEIEYLYDGDTYIVWIDGKKEKIRVLGIDTPEKKGGFRPEGCYGGHASTYAKKALLGKKVGLLKPKNHESKDKYGRLLRYVFLDGKDFGAHLIEEGYAFSYKRFSHPRLKYYNQLEKKSQKNKKGMWNPDNCDYWGQNNLID